MRRPLIVGNSAGVSTIAPTRPMTRPTCGGRRDVEQAAGPGGGPGQPEQAADRRRLPRPVRPEEPEHPAGGDHEVEPVDRHVRSAAAGGGTPCAARRSRSPVSWPPACGRAVPRSLRTESIRRFRCDRLPGGVQPAGEVTRVGGWRRAGGRRCSAHRASSATAPWSPSTPARPPRCSATSPSPPARSDARPSPRCSGPTPTRPGLDRPCAAPCR